MRKAFLFVCCLFKSQLLYLQLHNVLGVMKGQPFVAFTGKLKIDAAVHATINDISATM